MILIEDLREREETTEGGYKILIQGLKFTRILTKGEALTLGRTLVKRRDGASWALGDWLIEGGRTDRQWFGGSTYENAAKITGYGISWLSNLHRVCLTFPPDGRHPELSFSTHKEILRAAEHERPRIIKMAKAKSWSSDDVITYVNSLIPKQKSDRVRQKRTVGSYYSSPKVRCPNVVICRECGHSSACRHEFSIKGHKV